VWSYETALDIYELSDVMPSKMHMTVPSSFRKRAPIPPQLVLHYSNLQEQEMRAQQGYRITTPLRTLIDVIEEGVLSHDLLLQALTEALQRGVVSRKDIETTPDGSKIRDVFNEIKV
jgi:predicted transcriptional regulator of viral defense system